MWDTYLEFAKRDDALTLTVFAIIGLLIVGGAIAELVKKIRSRIKAIREEARMKNEPPPEPKIYTTEVSSDLGPVALVKWRFHPSKPKRPGVFSPVDGSCVDLGDTHAGIEETLQNVGKRLVRDIAKTRPVILREALAEKGQKWRDLLSSAYNHYDFTEDDLRRRASQLPIEVLEIVYTDRRRALIREPQEPSDEGIKVGVTIPAPVEVPAGTPYYKLPPLKASEPLAVPYSTRRRHVYIIGRGDMGKSTLIRNIARQDIESGKGVCVIDPHGDLIDHLIPYIPEARVPDTVYFNAVETPISLNLFNAASDLEKSLIVGEMIDFFKKTSENWGDRMDPLIRYSVRTLLDVPGTTFLDIHEILVSKSFRESILQKIAHPKLLHFWRETYPSFTKGSEQPVVNRMAKYVLDDTLARVLGGTSQFSFYDALQQGKILLFDLKKGLSDDAKALLGALLISQIEIASGRRASLPIERRTPCHMFIDEFHTFATPELAKIIAESRKFGLFLTAAHQNKAQLTDTQVRSAMEGAGHAFFFVPFDSDLRSISSLLPRDVAAELSNLDMGEAIYKPTKATEATKVKIDFPPLGTHNSREAIIANTRQLYVAKQLQPAPAPLRDELDEEPGLSGPPE
jgi:Type IV secretion-system coupling protein DNA-binding domain